MAEKKEKVRIPVYRMGLRELYLLLRIRMEQTGRKNVNGVKKSFLEPETYEKHEKLLKSLARRKLLEQQDGNLMLSQGLLQGLDVILDSAHCMSFRNEALQKKGQILSFYYADGRFAGVLQDDRNSLLVCTDDREAVYMAFEKILEAKGISADFHAARWTELYGEEIAKPVREAAIVHTGNRRWRQLRTLAMVSDKRRIYLLEGEDDQRREDLGRDTQAAANWFGIVLRELERLKEEGEAADGMAPEEKEPPKKKTEYQRIVESEGFPRSGKTFWFWVLRKMLAGFPVMIKGAAEKRFRSLLLYLAWAVALFFYNMYATCYLNDTFMLDRRAVWGNLTPYLMAGTMDTPNPLKGFNAAWGHIDTVFLVWPLMMLVTLIGRHVVLQIKNRKLGFLASLLGIPGDVDACRRLGYGRGRQMWVPFLVVWTAGFFIMNPVTLFLAALYCFLVFAQKDNRMVRLCLLWRCAGSRKQVEAGKRREPEIEKYRLMVFHMGCGFLIYGLVSLALWHVVGYHFWIRLIVTMLMAIFALLQIFWPGMLSDPEKAHRARTLLLIIVGGMAACWFSSRYGIVLADDGGWSESGRTLGGFLQNAGFSTIFGLSILTIGLALGGTAGLVIAALGALGGAGMFAIGCSEGEAGDYVRKSARQFFFGPEDGESKTILCMTTEVANFVAGFLHPAVGSGSKATKVFYGGRVVTDVVSLGADSYTMGMDLANSITGNEKVGAGTLIMDALGLGLDIYGFCGDWDSFGDVKWGDDAYRYAKDPKFTDEYKRMEDEKNQQVADMWEENRADRQVELDLETSRHNEKLEDIQESIRKTQEGDITPPMDMDRDAYLEQLNRTLGTEESIFADTMAEIRDKYGREARKLEDAIIKNCSREELKLIADKTAEWVGNGYSTEDIFEKLMEFKDSWDAEDAGAGGDAP